MFLKKSWRQVFQVVFFQCNVINAWVFSCVCHRTCSIFPNTAYLVFCIRADSGFYNNSSSCHVTFFSFLQTRQGECERKKTPSIQATNVGHGHRHRALPCIVCTVLNIKYKQKSFYLKKSVHGRWNNVIHQGQPMGNKGALG